MFPVADDPDFSSPRWQNSDFARIAGNKTIAKTRVSGATYADLEKVENCLRTLVAGQRQSYWLLSALDLNYKVSNCACADLSFSVLHVST